MSVEPRRREDQDADLRLLFADRMWLRSSAGTALVAALQRSPTVAAVRRHRSAVLLRFDDTTLARLEQRLAEGEMAGMYSSDVLDGKRFMVSFVGANTNKALHVGHLRNILLGQALASALTAAGATVERHSLVGDIGRRVCEAMVGYLSHHYGETPHALGLAGDRFVERCSRDGSPARVQTDAASRTGDPDAGDGSASQAGDPNAEENEVRGDWADAIMRAWLLGAPAELALWRRMREWVLDSHRDTLARLGVAIDRHDCESQAIERALALVERGLHAGLFTREASGGVIYRTGRSEYTTMVLLRKDGAPTEYARLLGLYDRILDDLGGEADFVEVVGIEWQPAATALGEVLAALRHSPDGGCRWAYHGSVTVGGRKMGSSTGEVRWIDDLLDEVATSAGVVALHELAAGAVDPQQLADMVVRGNFLCSPTAQPLVFLDSQLLGECSSPGWTIAQAWCRAQRPRESRSGAPVARTALVQSQLYGQALRRTIAAKDPASLATYLLGLCEACLAASEPGPATAPMLRHVLGSLGFLVAQRPVRDRQEPLAPSAEEPMPVHAGVGGRLHLRP